jgi:kinesin family protein 1
MTSMASAQLEIMLEKNEMKAEELTMTWMDKWTKPDVNSQLQNVNNSPSLRHKRLSSGIMVQPEQPYLVSLNSDPLSSDIMIYGLKQGETILGNNESTAEICTLLQIFNFDF